MLIKNNAVFKPFLALIFVFILSQHAFSGEKSFEPVYLKINPMDLAALKECYNITSQLNADLFSGWDLEKTPFLFYKPNIQEILINFPYKPEGFQEYNGFTPFNLGTIYVRNDKTFFTSDAQYTSVHIDGIYVPLVADPSSGLRNDLLSIIKNRPKDAVISWVQNREFEEDPYNLICVILHEGFHAYEYKIAPKKSDYVSMLYKYPVIDPVNNALLVIEGNILTDALLAKKSDGFPEKVKQFVAVRTYRQARLEPAFAEYEKFVEYSEGLARYVELKFLQRGEKMEPVRDMYYYNGFYGYKGVLYEQYEKKISRILSIDEKEQNKSGPISLKLKFYETGALQGLLLDEILPHWKKEIFKENIYQSDLLAEHEHLSDADIEKYLNAAKMEYNYEKIYESKLKLKQEAEYYIKEKTGAILNTNKTLVKIVYKKGFNTLSCSMSGITPVTPEMTLYEMIPVKITFDGDYFFAFKKAIPVLVDTGKKEIIFAVNTPVSKLKLQDGKMLETEDFILSASNMEIKKKENSVTIYLKD